LILHSPINTKTTTPKTNTNIQTESIMIILTKNTNKNNASKNEPCQIAITDKPVPTQSTKPDPKGTK
ncbi:hypothetical protein AAGG49_22330, partial [Stenotrophomonas maltophilia]|uniref:hypothetical protein n=1 Tax=Stenotrophomonas maltophilia TaxID=40324 RepID=UPI00313BB50B